MVKYITNNLVLICIFVCAIITPMVCTNQIITGSIINTLIIYTTLYIGLYEGCIIGLIPSSIAFLSGIIDYSSVIPIIILGNLILSLSLFYTKKLTLVLRLLIGSISKFIFITTFVLFKLFFSIQFGYLQLITAILGSIIVYIYSLKIQ